MWYRQIESYVGPEKALLAFRFRYRKVKFYNFYIYKL